MARTRAPAGAAAAAWLLVLLVLLLSTGWPQGAEARNGRRQKSKKNNGGGQRTSCAALERNCGFIDDSALSFAENAAIFTLTTADDGSFFCSAEVDFPDESFVECNYDVDSGILQMQMTCPGGTDFAVVEQTCAPFVDDGTGEKFVDIWRLPAPSQQGYFEVAYCSAPEVSLPEPGSAISWYVYIDCAPRFAVDGEASKTAGGGAKAAAAPAVVRRKIGRAPAAKPAAAAAAAAAGK